MYIHQPKQCQQNLPVERENTYFCVNQEVTNNIHTCQLSGIIQESPRYRKNLPVSCTDNQISRIQAILNLCTSVPKRPVSKCTLIKTILFCFFKLNVSFLEALFRIGSLLTTKPHVEGN